MGHDLSHPGRVTLLIAAFAMSAPFVFAFHSCTQSARDTKRQNPVSLPGTVLPTATIELPQGKKTVFSVEVVSTAQTRELGLMFRKELPEDRGMLFVFEDETEHFFWMKNTLIPLDMIFIRSDWKVAGIVHEAVPQSLEARSVGRPSKYVLEIGGGLAKKLGIVEGLKVRITPEGYW